MFFTREDILKIQQALLQLGVKDSELPSAESVTYNDTLSIIQDGKNKQIKIEDFFNQISLWKREDFINITDKYDEHYIMLLEAINLVPVLQRKDGLVITFQDTNGNWRIYQFRGNITEFLNKEKWFDLYDYRNYIVQSIVPDEEDLTASIPDESGNSLVHLKDRVYNPTIFNGKGYKFVRKNIINVELATIKISVINPTTLEGDIYFNINNKGTKVHLSPTIHNTTKLVSEAIKDVLNIVYTDYEVTVANSIVTLTRKYSGNISPTTFEMYNTGVRVIVEDSTTIDERNIITQEDINEKDTIYEIRYNFDLDGKTIIIPNNCVLYFTSGKFYNGNINMNNTIITTLYEDILSEVNINGSYYNIQEHIKNYQRQLDDKQSQIDDKQQQITANDEDISLLQTRSTQMEEAIKGISASGGASQASAVTYENTESGLNSITAQGAIDELANKKLNKENIAQEFGDSKDKVVSQFALPFREIESPEFIKLIVDAEDHFLFGIQLDGSIEWGKGIPTPIRTKLQEIITQCQQDKTDLLGSINTINDILDKTTIKDEAGEIQDTPFRVIENEEFIMALVDSEDKLLFGIYRATGKPYYQQNDMYHISQSEEFLWVILDTANHPLLGIQQDGTCWAAKAQWLDDIKAIKEALSSIDETLKTFQPKEDGKGLINLDVADSFFYISNDEYIIAVVDAENRILAGIKYDGEPYFPNHEMYSVITNEEWLYAIIDAEDKVICGFHADDGHMIVGGIDINTFIVDVSDIKERTAHLSTIENDEYLSVETDSEGKVIGYTAPDGSHYLYKVKSETIPEEFSHIEDHEGRTEITTDAEGNVLDYRNSEGVKSVENLQVKVLQIGNDKPVNSNQDICNNVINNIKNVVSYPYIPDLPHFGRINILEETFYLTFNDGYSNSEGVVPIQIYENTDDNAKKGLTVSRFYVKSSLTDNNDGTYSLKEDSIPLDFYVPKEVVNIDGTYYVKKTLDKTDNGYTINSNSIKVTEIKMPPVLETWKVDKKTEHNCKVSIDFGSYLSEICNIGIKYQGRSTLYRLKRNLRFTFYNENFSKKKLIKLGEFPEYNGFNLKAYYNDATRIKEPLIFRLYYESRMLRDMNEQTPWNKDYVHYTSATGCYINFPVTVKINNSFWAVMYFGNKKDGCNYMLDSDSDGMIVSGLTGDNDWLRYKEQWEDEMNDSLTESNIEALKRFHAYLSNTEGITKENLNERIYVNDFIDYFIFITFFRMRDNDIHNLLLYSGKDKQKFSCFLYDCDLSINIYNYDMEKEYTYHNSIWKILRKYYWEEICERYVFLRQRILNERHIEFIVRDLQRSVPFTDFKNEIDKWKITSVKTTDVVSQIKELMTIYDKYFITKK